MHLFYIYLYVSVNFIFLLDDRGILVQAELEYIQQYVNADPLQEDMVALAFSDGSSGTCPVSWLKSGKPEENNAVKVDWEGQLWDATILKVSGEKLFISCIF